jgi:hypothetical protein
MSCVSPAVPVVPDFDGRRAGRDRLGSGELFHALIGLTSGHQSKARMVILSRASTQQQARASLEVTHVGRLFGASRSHLRQRVLFIRFTENPIVQVSEKLKVRDAFVTPYSLFDPLR